MRSPSSWRRVRVERGIYLVPNGRYYVCARRAGRLRARTVGPDLALARSARAALVSSIEAGLEPASPRLRFDTVAGWWLARFEARVAAGERHPRTLEAHRYHLEHHLLPALAPRRMSALTVDDVAGLLGELRAKGGSPKTSAGALATLHGIVRYARRPGWIATNPVEQLESHERPRPARWRQRVLGRGEIERLLTACAPRDRLIVATALYTGLRISELLGLVWDDIDFDSAWSMSARSSPAPTAASRLGAWPRRPLPRSGTSRSSRSSPGCSPRTSSQRRSPPQPTGYSLPRAARPMDIETSPDAA